MRSSLFETDNAKYYHIYAHHSNIYPEDIPVIGNNSFVKKQLKKLNKKNYPTMEDILTKEKISSLDGLILENYDADDDVFYLEHSSQYELIIKNILKAEKKPPIYLLDIDVESDWKNNYKIAIGAGLGFITLSSIPEGIAYYKMKKSKNTKKEKITRRDFIKMSCLHTFNCLLGMYFIVGHLYAPYRLGFNKGKADELSRKLVYLHTEMFQSKTINLRNAVWAEKMETMVAQDIKKNKPTIAIVTGCNHAGLKEYLQDKNKRKKIIEKYKYSILQMYEKEKNMEFSQLDDVLVAIPNKNDFGTIVWNTRRITKKHLFI